MSDEPKTWHYGLMARWWVEFNVASTDELAFYRDQIVAGGGPALDLGCGTGRLLIPLLAEGLSVHGCDLSPDMIGECRTAAASLGVTPVLFVQPMHRLDLPHRYRTIYICGSFGIGGEREHDREALQRCYRHLEEGGRLVLNLDQPYSDARAWAYWVPEQRQRLPRPWRETGTRRGAANGEELELRTRLFDFDPLLQRLTLESRIAVWRDGKRVVEEERQLCTTVYFRNELLLMLEMAGFHDVRVLGGYSGSPTGRDDPMLVYVATK